MINPKDSKCCGCGACSDVCPVSAIRMITADDGFVYPEVDGHTCIG